MKLPTLYKKTSKGKIEQWTIWVEPSPLAPGAFKIVTEHGHVDGKLQRTAEVVAEGKNLGKANATTAEQQAQSQAESEWTTKKTRKGYVEDLARAQAGDNDGAGGIRPMLAQAFSKHGDKLTFPCYAQPKLDGIRCIATVNGEGHVHLWSREQKPITAVPHINRAVAELRLPAGTVLDGELYNHALKNDFEKIVSAVRKVGPADPTLAEMVQYHIYDLPRHPELTGAKFSDRAVKLALIIPKTTGPLVWVETNVVHDKDALLEIFDRHRAQGYEGAMARNNETAYEEGKRSYSLLKLKEFDEAEFPIVGVEEGVGKMAGLAIFVCSNSTPVPGGIVANATFKCKMEGSLEGLRKYLEDESTWRGKKLTVKYQGLTGKAGVPRFPVGKIVRDYE